MKAKNKDRDPTNKSPNGNSDDSVTRVQNAVLDILEKEGVLSGINLNEVAKHAKVNRGLVYHHFGTRRGLLRSAIRRRMIDKQQENRTPTKPMKLGERVAHALRATLDIVDTLRLTTLLHLDGSSAPDLMPNAETTLILLERDREMGLLPDVEDLKALHASYAAAVYGYAIYREIFARDLDIDLEDLDARVEKSFQILFDGGMSGPEEPNSVPSEG
ncbi:MAG: TetR/AcrR family transcriptional regulator [Sneathiella sp.]|uniref:TetR/AcrR family transcriptional regulator n=1 Tax=Sneathiella sp. TaxID=1964365 RepID=UPI003002C0B2